MQIDDYSFGSITVDGLEYKKDLIVFPDHIQEDWWREEGHNLSIDDLKEVIAFKPDVLIVGTGASGMMRIPTVTKEALEKYNIKLVAEDTHQAYKIFNEFIERNERVVGAFHLTC